MLDMVIVVCIIRSQCSHMDRNNVSFIDDCNCLVSYIMAHCSYGNRKSTTCVVSKPVKDVILEFTDNFWSLYEAYDLDF